MQKLIFFIDDSGSLTDKNGDLFFVYGGSYFLSDKEKSDASRKIIDLKKQSVFANDELKFVKIKEKRDRIKMARRVGSILNTCSIVTHIQELDRVNFNNSLDVGRHKDYIIKRLVKCVILELISKGLIDPDLSLKIELYIDQQLTRTNGKYELDSSITEELTMGMSKIINGVKYLHPPIWRGCLDDIKIKFCKSENHALIQAADIIAGYIRMCCKDGDKPNSLGANHIHKKLP